MSASDDELRQQLTSAEEKLRRYQEAIELWDALDLEDNQQVVAAVLVGKLKDFDSGIVAISIGNTNGMDWVDQVGLLEAARIISHQEPIEPAEGRDD